MARWRTAAVLLALMACTSLAAARSSSAQRAQKRRGLEENEGWVDVKVVNRCSEPVVFKAGYNFWKGVDEGHPCPNKGPGSNADLSVCTTDWLTIDANTSATFKELPDLLWWFSAFVEDADPAVFISKQSAEAFLGGDDDYNAECNTPQEGTCVWWAVPKTRKAGTRLVLRCPELDGAAPPPVNETTVEMVNNCSVAVKVKAAYSMTEDDDGAGCVINTWLGKDNHLCVTDWQTLEAGEKRYLAATASDYWTYGAHIAADTGYDLAKRVPGAFQGSNETTGCPEEDPYGSGYVCEWWAPTYDVKPSDFDASVPVSITCDDYTPPN